MTTVEMTTATEMIAIMLMVTVTITAAIIEV